MDVPNLTDANNLSVFPNPSNGIFNISIENIQGVTKNNMVEIYNVIGEKIYTNPNFQQATNKIDISSYGKGVYFIKINVGEKIYSGKILVQ